MMSAVRLSAVMLSAVRLSTVRLSAVRLSAVRLSAVDEWLSNQGVPAPLFGEWLLQQVIDAQDCALGR